MATLKQHLAKGTLPKHLEHLTHRFDEDAPVHPRMADSANWMNEGDTLEGEPIYVRYNGAVRPCTNLIHLGQWLSDSAVIVPKPA